MKFTAISLIFLIIMPIVSALTFDFSSPASAETGRNFSVSISATTSDVYDVKIFVQDNETKIIISSIYNGGWKNPYFYLKELFPSQSNFIIRVNNYSSDATICARLRKTGGSSYNERCNVISVQGAASSSDSSGNEEDIQQEEIEANDTTPSQTIGGDFIPSGEGEKQSPQSSPQPSQAADSAKIFLNPKDSSKEIFITKDEKLRIYAVYSFTALAILIIIFLVFRRL